MILPHEKTLAGPEGGSPQADARDAHADLAHLRPLPRRRRRRARDHRRRDGGAVPALDATTADGVRHRLWRLGEPAAIAGLVRLLADKQILIADGHHRYETLLGLGPELRALDYAAGGAAADFAMMFLARAEDPGLLVLPTHRLVRDLPDFDFAALCAAARRGLRHRRGRRGDGAGDRGAARARGDRGRGVRGARAGARAGRPGSRSSRSSISRRWGRRRCASWT